MIVSLTSMTSEERREWYRHIGRKGGRARAQMPDFPEHQRRAGKHSAQVNDMSYLGRLGVMAYYASMVMASCFAWRVPGGSKTPPVTSKR